MSKATQRRPLAEFLSERVVFTDHQAGARGPGLGNLLVPWAKALLLAEYLEADCIPPTMGLNPRGYWRDFGTPRYDFVSSPLARRARSSLSISNSLASHSRGLDLKEITRDLIHAGLIRKTGRLAITAEGMWGGFAMIRAAAPAVKDLLMSARGVEENLGRLALGGDDPIVAVHIRGGDFAPPSVAGAYRGQFNRALPLEWYRSVCIKIADELPRARFIVVGDSYPDPMLKLCAELKAETTQGLGRGDVSDLLILASADLLVCSISSYSMWGAFLSGRPYIWYRPQLTAVNGGLTMWADDAGDGFSQRTLERNWEKLIEMTSQPMQSRCIAVGGGTEINGGRLRAAVGGMEESWMDETDPLFYGIAPSS